MTEIDRNDVVNMSGEVLDTFTEEVLGSKSTLKELLITLEND